MPKHYLHAFDPYQGKTYKGDEIMESDLGKAASTVMHLIGGYSDSAKVLPYHFFFDNFFTTVQLLVELAKRDYDGTGTITSNRLDKTCPLPSVAQIDKKERRTVSSVSGKVHSKEIKVTRWKDNAVVTMFYTPW